MEHTETGGIKSREGIRAPPWGNIGLLQKSRENSRGCVPNWFVNSASERGKLNREYFGYSSRYYKNHEKRNERGRKSKCILQVINDSMDSSSSNNDDDAGISDSIHTHARPSSSTKVKTRRGLRQSCNSTEYNLADISG